jgi:hypothetical protein
MSPRGIRGGDTVSRPVTRSHVERLVALVPRRKRLDPSGSVDIVPGSPTRDPAWLDAPTISA